MPSVASTSVSIASIALGLGVALVIEAEEMQHAVHDEMGDVIGERGMCLLARLREHGLGGEHHIAERPRLAELRRGSPAGKDSTLVEASLPRQVRFSARISASSVRTMVDLARLLPSMRSSSEGGARRAREGLVAHRDAVPESPRGGRPQPRAIEHALCDLGHRQPWRSPRLGAAS